QHDDGGDDAGANRSACAPHSRHYAPGRPNGVSPPGDRSPREASSSSSVKRSSRPKGALPVSVLFSGSFGASGALASLETRSSASVHRGAWSSALPRPGASRHDAGANGEGDSAGREGEGEVGPKGEVGSGWPAGSAGQAGAGSPLGS